jgi:protein-disulfide isomerase
MRNLLFSAAILLFATNTFAMGESPATPIPAQSRPVQSKPSDPTIKETGGKEDFVTSYLITEAPFKSDYVLGNRNAPIKLVEYASLSCPHCAHFSTAVLPKLEEKYIKTGKLAYILRQFPLNEPALRGAMLVSCVGESSEEKYYTFARVLFESQTRWAFDSNFMTGLETIATVGGISRAQFQSCVNDKDREMAVLENKKKTNDELKVPYTPYLIFNGAVYKGDVTAEAVSQYIDAKLAKLKK